MQLYTSLLCFPLPIVKDKYMFLIPFSYTLKHGYNT